MKIKLVRDKLPFPMMGNVTLKRALLALKLFEESAEIADDPSDPAEYADLLEVMLELARLNGVPWAAIERKLWEKRELKGAFRLGRYKEG